MKIALTGGSGGIGRAITRRGAEPGPQLVSIDRVPGRTAETRTSCASSWPRSSEYDALRRAPSKAATR